ncbi:MAG: cysteine desulfurase [Planctomycetes bacterium]|nr:cysteine desulfurase [Planctomycetota bacterium]
MLYLDHASTAPPIPDALEAFVRATREAYANPGSLHALGAQAMRALETARSDLRRAFGARQYRVVLTATGTEANDLGIRGMARSVRASVERASGKPPRILVSSIEHPCSLQPAQALADEGFVVDVLEPDAAGVVRPDSLCTALDEDVALVSLHWANNELGSLLPITELVQVTRAHAPHAIFHTDAVQAAGKRTESFDSLGADSIAIAAHKFGGVRGCAALFLRDNAADPQPLSLGGGHESGLRAGTENVMGAVAMAKAATIRRERLTEDPQRNFSRRAHLLNAIRAASPDCIVVGPQNENDCLGPILSVAFPGMIAETLLHALEAEGIACGSGSACSSHGHTESVILRAINLPQELRNSVLRFSLDGTENQEDLDSVGAALSVALARLT